MDSIKKILAVVDPGKDHQPALSRSIELATKSQACITTFLPIYDFSYEMTTMLSSEEREAMRKAVIDDRKEWLDDLIEQHKQSETHNVEINTQVIWHNRPFEAIIKTVLQQSFDIVVKGTHQHDTLKSVIFTPTDWHLIRKCPTPVLLVKEHEWPIGGQVIAAVNAASEDHQHQELNNKIIKDAQFITQLASAELNLVNSYPGTPVNIAIEIPEFDPTSYNQTMREHHIKATSQLAEKYDIAADKCFVEEGLPEDVLPHIAKKLDAELVVIGTIGRTGITAALIGNTAEHVIDSLDSDVLALKPDGYISPIKPD